MTVLPPLPLVAVSEISPVYSVGHPPGLYPAETPLPPSPFIFRILMKINTLHLQTSKGPSDNKELTRRTPSENRHFPPQILGFSPFSLFPAPPVPWSFGPCPLPTDK
jgi:hypothetical protein